jgi:hypothetical protein
METKSNGSFLAGLFSTSSVDPSTTERLAYELLHLSTEDQVRVMNMLARSVARKAPELGRENLLPLGKSMSPGGTDSDDWAEYRFLINLVQRAKDKVQSVMEGSRARRT